MEQPEICYALRMAAAKESVKCSSSVVEERKEEEPSSILLDLELQFKATAAATTAAISKRDKLSNTKTPPPLLLGLT